MKSKPRLVFWELVLILASVPIFRGIWLLLDGIEWLNRPAGLWASLAVGGILASVALAAIERVSNK